MAQCKIGRNIQARLNLTHTLGLLKIRQQRLAHQLVLGIVWSPLGFLYPFICIFHRGLDGVGEDISIAILAIAHLDEIATHSLVAIAEVGGLEAVLFKHVHECGGIVLEVVFCMVTHFLQYARIIIKEVIRGECFIEFLAVVSIDIAENIPSKAFDEIDDIPALVLGYVLFDVLHNPAKDLVVDIKPVYQFVNCLFFHLHVIESYVQIGCEVEFTCHIA